MDTFVDSSWYFLRYCSPHYDDGPVRRRGGARLDAGRRSTSAASSTRSCTCCTAGSSPRCCTTWAWSTSSSRSRALLNQGQVINQGKAMSKSLGNGVNLGDMIDAYGVDAVRLTLVFAGPPEDDIDWADLSPGGSLKFLQRAWRLSGDVTSAPGASPAEGGDVALRKVTHRTRARGRAAGRVAPVQRAGRPDDGAGQRHPQGDRLRLRPGRPRRARGRRGGRDPAVPGRAVHRRGDVGAAGPPADRRPRRLAERRPGPAGRGLGHRRRPGAGQAARQAGGQPGHHRGRPGGRWRWPTRPCSGRWRASRSAR